MWKRVVKMRDAGVFRCMGKYMLFMYTEMHDGAWLFDSKRRWKVQEAFVLDGRKNLGPLY